MVNLKRVYRLYCLEALHVRQRPRKKLIARPRLVAPVVAEVNDRWSMDFMSARLACGRRFRPLTALDLCSREALTISAARSFPSEKVTEILDRLIAKHGKPSVIQVACYQVVVKREGLRTRWCSNRGAVPSSGI
jgi:putative transposase